MQILDADDMDAPLAEVVPTIDGQSDWETVSRSIPAAALGKNVKLQFNFQADEFNGSAFPGWYIDDVSVTVP